MGLGAFVPCNCWTEGLTTEPPFARDQLEFCDGCLELRDVPGRSPDVTIAMRQMLQRWLETCCPHHDMECVDERVGDWTAVRAFSGFARQRDTGQFPVLRDLMPDGNGGEASPADCARGLAELNLLSDVITGQSGYFQIDDGTTFLGIVGISGTDRDREAVTRPLTLDDVPWVDELRHLVQASLATGNPVS